MNEYQPGTEPVVDESQLIDRAQTGEPEAFSELYAMHWPTVATLAGRRTGDPSAAEDLAQEVFIRAMGNLDRFENFGGGLAPWLTTITINSSNDYHRMGARRPKEVPLGNSLLATTAGEGDDDTADHALAGEGIPGVSDDALEAALARLKEEKPEFFDALWATVVIGLKSGEYGAHRGVTPATVRSRTHRAKSILKTVLSG